MLHFIFSIFLKYLRLKLPNIFENYIEADLFQIKSSSDPDKSYFVTSDTCECFGFKNYYKFHHGNGQKANCSHLEAIRIFKQARSD